MTVVVHVADAQLERPPGEEEGEPSPPPRPREKQPKRKGQKSPAHLYWFVLGFLPFLMASNPDKERLEENASFSCLLLDGIPP